MSKTRLVLAAALLLGAAAPRLAYGQLSGSGIGSPLGPYGAMQQGVTPSVTGNAQNPTDQGDPTSVLKDVKRDLKDADPNVRVQGLKKLRDLKDLAANKLLIGALSDPDIRVRMKAIDLLGARQVNEGVAPMAQLLFLRSTEPAVRLHVAAALGRAGDTQGALPVMQFLEGQMKAGNDERARGTAVFALGEIGSPKATRLLTRIADQDRSDLVRRLAREALAKIGGEIPTRHSIQLAQQKMKTAQPTDEKLAKLREFDQKLQATQR